MALPCHRRKGWESSLCPRQAERLVVRIAHLTVHTGTVSLRIPSRTLDVAQVTSELGLRPTQTRAVGKRRSADTVWDEASWELEVFPEDRSDWDSLEARRNRCKVIRSEDAEQLHPGCRTLLEGVVGIVRFSDYFATFFACARNFAHRFLAAFPIFALAAADNTRFFAPVSSRLVEAPKAFAAARTPFN